MGFLNWFKEQPEETSEASQMDLLGNSLPVRSRVDGAIVRKEFTKTIKEKGGGKMTQAQATEAMTRELFGCGTNEIYRETGANQSKRETLPYEAQTAYIVGEAVCTDRLKETPIEGSDSQKHAQIVDVVESTTRNEVKGLFRWNRK
jgi:hypothetical protein